MLKGLTPREISAKRTGYLYLFSELGPHEHLSSSA